MNLSNYYWSFKSAVPAKICDDIINFGLSQNEEIANIGNFNNKKLTQDNLKTLKRTRNSNIAWLDEPWIYKEVQPYIHQANKNAGWNFSWDWSESCQFTKYKLNQYYDWHIF